MFEGTALAPSNKRLKLTARGDCGMNLFSARRSLSAQFCSRWQSATRGGGPVLSSRTQKRLQMLNEKRPNTIVSSLVCESSHPRTSRLQRPCVVSSRTTSPRPERRCGFSRSAMRTTSSVSSLKTSRRSCRSSVPWRRQLFGCGFAPGLPNKRLKLSAHVGVFDLSPVRCSLSAIR